MFLVISIFSSLCLLVIYFIYFLIYLDFQFIKTICFALLPPTPHPPPDYACYLQVEQCKFSFKILK